MNNLATVIQLETVRDSDLFGREEVDCAINCDRFDEGPFRFNIHTNNDHFTAGTSRGSFTLSDLKGLYDQLFDYIRPLLEHEYDQERAESVRLQIAGLGNDIFRQVLSPELQALVPGWYKEGAIIDIITSDPWIPWEILHDGNDFWGAKYVIRRRPKLSIEIGTVLPRGKRRRFAGSVRRVVNVIGSNLHQDYIARSKTLFSRLPEPLPEVFPTDGHPVSLSRLKELIAETDVVHFTCHGYVQGGSHYLELGPEYDQHLTVSSVRTLHLDGGLVFANACSSAGLSPFLNRFSSFGWYFYEAGAEAFIGTLLPVPTPHAMGFAERFYETWGTREMSCGMALRKIKSEMSSKNLFWLFYCLYGNDRG